MSTKKPLLGDYIQQQIKGVMADVQAIKKLLPANAQINLSNLQNELAGIGTKAQKTVFLTALAAGGYLELTQDESGKIAVVGVDSVSSSAPATQSTAPLNLNALSSDELAAHFGLQPKEGRKWAYRNNILHSIVILPTGNYDYKDEATRAYLGLAPNQKKTTANNLAPFVIINNDKVDEGSLNAYYEHYGITVETASNAPQNPLNVEWVDELIDTPAPVVLSDEAQKELAQNSEQAQALLEAIHTNKDFGQLDTIAATDTNKGLLLEVLLLEATSNSEGAQGLLVYLNKDMQVATFNDIKSRLKTYFLAAGYSNTAAQAKPKRTKKP